MKWQSVALLIAKKAAPPTILATSAALVDVGLLDGEVYRTVEAVLKLFG
jgi:hypothetical protein